MDDYQSEAENGGFAAYCTADKAVDGNTYGVWNEQDQSRLEETQVKQILWLFKTYHLIIENLFTCKH